MAEIIVKDSWRKQRAFTESYLLDKVEKQEKTIQGINEVIANMKSNRGSHATFIEQLEQLVGNGDQL